MAKKEDRDIKQIDENTVESSPATEKTNIDEATPSETPKAAARGYTFGQKLAEARQRSRMHLERISKELNIREDYLVAIEESDPKRLPEPVFTMGFIRSFAKMVRSDPQEHIDQYKREVLHWKEETKAPVPASPPASFNQTWVIGAALVGVLLLYGIWFIVNQSNTRIPVKAAVVTKAKQATATTSKAKETAKEVKVPTVVAPVKGLGDNKSSANKPTELPHSSNDAKPTPAVDDE